MLVRKTQILIGVFFVFLRLSVSALSTGIVVGPQTRLIDGSVSPFNQLAPGDTIYLLGGKWDNLSIRNFRGSVGKPIIFINKSGVVYFDSDHNHAMSVQNCQFFRITGTGSNEFYGIQVERVESGTGIGIGGLSSDFEIDHISIKNVPIAGIYAKTDPDCSLKSLRGKFVQKNTLVHDNYIENAGNEGLYIGNTNYFGQKVNCKGKDTLLLPSLLDGVKIYNNIIKSSGWDGIQVSSASKDCEVFGNQIFFDSQAEVPNQMSGIIIGGGSKCSCYNNLIAEGKGDGIELHGLGGSWVFNNIIVNSGRNYFSEDFSSSKMKHGIFVSDVSVEHDSSFYIQNNTIINPKSDGIRFSSVRSRNSLIASNAIVNPGNFDYYENGNFRFKGVDSYVMEPDSDTDIEISNNFFTRELKASGLSADYSPQKGSPLIDAGYPGAPAVTFDFANNSRPLGKSIDIGAMEFDPPTSTSYGVFREQEFLIFPNPVKDKLNILYQSERPAVGSLSISSLSGMEIIPKEDVVLSSGANRIEINMKGFRPGVYFITISINTQVFTGKLVKTE